MGIPLNIVKIVLRCIVVFALCRTSTTTDEKPAIFIFGDSLLDNGNNNYIVTLARANFQPYGIDFGGPTGRFTNGRTTADVLDQELGIGLTPPYMATTTGEPMVLKGVNYASGGGGILNKTGFLFGGRINFDAQIDNFANTREQIIRTIGVPATLELLKNALFTVALGSNDFLDNYLARTKQERELLPPDKFVETMISKLRVQLTRLFNLGARKIVVPNVGPMGCMPYMRDINRLSGDECAEFPNQLAQLFNTQLKSLIEELRTNLVGSLILYADAYDITQDMIKNYKKYGFENPSSACCHQAGRYGGLVTCTGVSKVCEDRSKYIFWDTFHPSDAANVFIAKRMLHGDSNDISPMNIGQLLQA
ncbi:GDSL esterase/lipase At4g16230 [Medicago truncatula]|uniref:GDSL-like lipase/acylhydrolase superfamily protein n=1 Tax=Medicago truncatula TaxID=3880 RepID=G7IMT4_MEDTR|nr:GDSL esterase/lipase At4g16230 [Medicago truncatula]AES64975.1 GDSL-like lipase/acylhydrolase superfamily protein [Medicago truncatula]